MHRDVAAAQAQLVDAWGPSNHPTYVGWSPGRATVLGEHLDYAGGSVLAIATDLGVAVALRRSASQGWRVASSGGRRVERAEPSMEGDIGDRVLAAVLALPGDPLLPLEVGIAASLPESAGLSSSAAVIVATLLAATRSQSALLSETALIDAAFRAEHDIVGIPCGRLDQTVVVAARERSALLMDFTDGGRLSCPWPWNDVALVACATTTEHDVGGEGYRRLSEEADAVLHAAGVTTAQQLKSGHLDDIPPGLLARGRQLVGEEARVFAGVEALRTGDAPRLGALLSESHRSLRDDLGASTATLDAVVAAAESAAGCSGARLVGAGFGGSAIALVAVEGIAECREVMGQAAGVGNDRTWVLHPCPGAGVMATDVVTRS